MDRNKRIRINKDEPNVSVPISIRDYRLRACSYDYEKRTLVDYSVSDLYGCFCEVQVYFTQAIIVDEAYERSENEPGEKMIGIPLICGGCVNEPPVFVKCDSSITEDEWKAKGARLTVGYF